MIRARVTPEISDSAIEEGQQVKRRFEMTPITKRAKIFIFGGFVLTIAAIALIVNSFSALEYYEMGFVKESFTGKVDRSKVYFGGRHYLGFQHSFKKFPRDAQFVEFSIIIFNADKLEVFLSGALLYFLNKDELKLLHDAYDLGYRPIIEKTSLQAIKNAAPKFSVSEYRLEREKIAKDLANAARHALGGICCPKDNDTYGAEPGCKAYSTCTDADKGVFCVMKHFQLEHVSITKEQEERFLKNVLEQEKYFTEQFKQQEKIERKKTEQEKNLILNKVAEVTQQAVAKAVYIKATANADARAVKEGARNSGLNLIHSQLNITNATHKASLDYIRTLLNHKGVSLYVGYNSLIAREGKV